MKRTWMILLLAASLLAACGDDNGGNNNTSKDVGTDVETDAGIDGGDTGVEPYGNETEPNDSVENANSFNAGDAISGRISAGSGDSSDVDMFKVDLSGGSIFEFELTDQGSGFDTADGNQLTVLFTDEQQNIRRYLLPDNGTKRQAFVPVDGTYYVIVFDARSGADQPTDNGGPDSTYDIATKTVDATPTSLSVGDDQSDALDEGEVDVFEVSPADDTTIIAETIAMRDPVGSDADTVLYAWSVADSQTIAANDDAPGQDGTYDSRMTFGTTGGNTYWVVVDSFTNPADGSYSLSLTETDDAPSARRALADGDSLSGEIADRGADDFDTDYFEVTLQPGDTIRLEAAASGDLQPRIDVFVPTQLGNITVAEGWPVDGTAAVELTQADGQDATEQTYLVNLDDLRNVPADENTDPANVGGTSYGYTISASAVTWTGQAATLPVAESGSIADVGNYAWYEFDVPANSILGLSATTSASDFEPMTAQLAGDGYAAVDQNVASIISDAGTVTAGVRDSYFRGGTGYDFDVSFVAPSYDGLTFNDMAEDDANDTQENAQDVTANLPVAVTGTLDAAGPSDIKPDYFGVTLSSGDVVGVMTEAGADDQTDDADTVVTILDPDGNVVFTNDDYIEQPNSFFSAAAFTADADGDYAVLVEPYCTTDPTATECGGNGDYTLKIFSE